MSIQVSNIRRQPGDSSTIALFDIYLDPGVTLLNWRLHRASDGVVTSYPPTARGGTPSAKAPIEVREQITAAAQAALRG